MSSRSALQQRSRAHRPWPSASPTTRRVTSFGRPIRPDAGMDDARRTTLWQSKCIKDGRFGDDSLMAARVRRVLEAYM